MRRLGVFVRGRRCLRWFSCLGLLGVALAGQAEGLQENLAEGGGAAPAGVSERMRWIRALPHDDAWWGVNGEAMRWYALNLSSFEPVVTVDRSGPVSELASAPNPAIGAFEVSTPDGPMAFDAFLDSDASTTMAVLILHRGRIVYERYPRQRPEDKPLFWSVTKALVATVVAQLEAEGAIDVEQPVDTYLPRLAGTAYGGVAVRDVLDMASGVDCGDEYVDPESCYYRYSASIGEGFRPPGSPDNPYDFIASLPPDLRRAEPGTRFLYSGVDTFVLGWLVEAVTGQPFHRALSARVWRYVGAEADALMWAGRNGVPLTSGGFMGRVRDVARFGLLFTPSHEVVSGQAVIPEAYLERILRGGRPALHGNAAEGDFRHSVYQWDAVYDNGDFMKGGWAGQGLMINPRRDLVAVWTGYHDASGGFVDILPMLREIGSGLYAEPVVR